MSLKISQHTLLKMVQLLCCELSKNLMGSSSASPTPDSASYKSSNIIFGPRNEEVMFSRCKAVLWVNRTDRITEVKRHPSSHSMKEVRLFLRSFFFWGTFGWQNLLKVSLNHWLLLLNSVFQTCPSVWSANQPP